MLPQGASLLNDSYFAALTARLQGAGSCEDLQALTNEVMASLSGVKDAIDAEVALLTPIVALLSGPAANPTAIVTWITDFINGFLTPYTAPVLIYGEQLAALATQITALTAAISAKQAEFPSCSITVPPL